jgi:hypothetical protein
MKPASACADVGPIEIVPELPALARTITLFLTGNDIAMI